MGDLMRLAAETCPSNLDWSVKCPSRSNPDEIYVVRYGELDPQERERQGFVSHGYTCTCKGYVYRAKCAHIEASKKVRCGWNGEMQVARTEDGKCPGCGRPTSPIEVGV